MSFLKKIFGGKQKKALSYKEFWDWFKQNEKTFYQVVKNEDNIEENLFDKLSPKLDEIKKGFNLLAGMFDEIRAELIFTPDGNITNIVFCEELVAAAPPIDNWKFTALKPALDTKDVNIEMNGYLFSQNTLFFYANETEGYPDEIDITVVCDHLNDENKTQVADGVFIYLDNLLGELNFVTVIDNTEVIGKDEAKKPLIPMAKLKDFLLWRQKEFVEKYEGIRHDTENDNYSGLEARLDNGKPMVALLNADLLNWDAKASHPWIVAVEIKYDGKNNNGMPDNETFELLTKIEDDIMLELKDFDGYLNIGRQTGNDCREIYFACWDFRKPSKVLWQTQEKYAGKIEIGYDIYKDKYWRSFNRFMPN